MFGILIPSIPALWEMAAWKGDSFEGKGRFPLRVLPMLLVNHFHNPPAEEVLCFPLVSLPNQHYLISQT